ncbi:MAG: hypothetical protein RQ754_06750 [Desulfuromonadales bacterium]|nr:hypothetical protein [Desulfuromonadales bacterium]
MNSQTLVLALIAISMSACATKQYPIATTLSPAEINLMTCHDLDLEVLRAD